MALMHLQTVPIRRSLDEARGRDFCLDFLGFTSAEQDRH
jgi:hypothetical protein